MYNRAQYVNRFYEKNLTTTVVTTSYYLGGTLVAQRENTTLRYTHQDHLSGTSLMTDTNGNSLGTMKYYPYGSTRSGSVTTDELFTGQKLDGPGLYYYGARYYDPLIGRFISPDPTIPDANNPQSYNRYSYCINNPTSAFDPSGLDYIFVGGAFSKQSDTWWLDMLVELGWDGTERVLYINDEFGNDPLEIASRGQLFEIQDQATALEDALLNGGYTDIKIIGHSEGAATTAHTLDKFTDTSSDLFKSGIGSELSAAIMLDMPVGRCNQVSGWDDRVMTGLPERLAGVDIKIGLADIYGTFIHDPIVNFTGWSGLSYQIYNPWVYYGFIPVPNSDYYFGHSSMRLEPETIDIIQDTIGGN